MAIGDPLRLRPEPVGHRFRDTSVTREHRKGANLIYDI
jgi:hypothetical protein